MPAFNEAEGIKAFLGRMVSFLEAHAKDSLAGLVWRLIVVNDGSRDETAARLAEAARDISTPLVQIEPVSLIRNFGHQAALLAGLRTAVSRRAAFVITMDADGEHPMDLIPELVSYWRKGALLVHTSRNPDPRLSRFKGASSNLYYTLLRWLGRLEIRSGMADYKLWDGKLLHGVRSFLNTCGSTRAFASWLIPEAPVVRYDQDVIDGRQSRFTLRKMLSLALSSLVRFSDFPIRLAFYIGLSALILGTVLFVFAITAFFMGKVIPGWTSIVALVVFFGGVQSMLLGIYGEYFLRNLFRANLPMFVIEPADGAHDQEASHENTTAA
jgi:dolichol-phosphate mannosyltransferase